MARTPASAKARCACFLCTTLIVLVRSRLQIGETDTGICGCPWRTWGVQEYVEEDPDTHLGADSSSGHDADGRSNRRGKGPAGGCESDRQELATVTSADRREWGLMDSCLGVSTANSISAGQAAQELSASGALPPYAADSFQRVNLSSTEGLHWPPQICRTDERWRPAQSSHTVAFRRQL